jgi:hypothetical protein
MRRLYGAFEDVTLVRLLSNQYGFGLRDIRRIA